MDTEIRGKTITIKATSRASVKVDDSFYTVEWCEERSVPEDCNIAEERSALWDICNNEVDAQIEEILKTFKKR